MGTFFGRTTRRAGNSMRKPSERPLRIAPTSSATARTAISFSGWRTVVSFGCTKAARITSSKPTTEMSSGTFNPAEEIASMAPNAMASLAAKMAVGGTGSASSACVSMKPLASLKSPWRRYAGSGLTPAARSASS